MRIPELIPVTLAVAAAGCGAGVTPIKSPVEQKRFTTADLCRSVGKDGTISPDQVQPQLCAIDLPPNVAGVQTVKQATAEAMMAMDLIAEKITEVGIAVECTFSHDPIQMATSQVVCRVIDEADTQCRRIVEDDKPGSTVVAITCPIPRSL